MLKKSSQELIHQIGQSLAWNIYRTRRLKYVQIKFLGSKKCGQPKEAKLYIGLYSKNV